MMIRKFYFFNIKLFLYLIVIFNVSWVTAFAEDGESLQQSLENSMQQAHNALIAKDYELFIKSIAPINPYTKITVKNFQTMTTTDHHNNLALSAFPDFFEDIRFLDLKFNDKWAIYIAETHIEDENYLTVSTFVFYKSDKGWLPAGKSYGTIKARPGSEFAKKGFHAWTNSEEVMETIQSAPEFQFESLLTEYFNRLEKNGIEVSR